MNLTYNIKQFWLRRLMWRWAYQTWSDLMDYDGTDPEYDFEDYQNMFWDYLNYGYIRDR